MSSVSMSSVSHRVAGLTAPAAADGSMLGASPAMQEVFRLIERVGPTEASVLLTGESGSGKELAARSIHECSPRGAPDLSLRSIAAPYRQDSSRPSCSATPRTASTGQNVHAGVFERAEGGTLLLDEVTEMPLDMQIRLLRVLETQKFYRVGASTEYTSDVRVIASTNRCPLQAVQSGQFREDLLYRLAVFPIQMPPLRSRGDDVELLAGHFLAELECARGTQKRLSALARMTLKQHSWPGNVRELKNCIERAFILGDGVLELAPLIPGARGATGNPVSDRERLEYPGGIANLRHGALADRGDAGLFQGQQAARRRRTGLQSQDAV